MKTIQRVTIVGGCGHVGLPLGIVLASKAGFQVDLLDIDPVKVEMVNSGSMPFMERGADALLREIVGKSLKATLDPSCMIKSPRKRTYAIPAAGGAVSHLLLRRRRMAVAA